MPLLGKQESAQSRIDIVLLLLFRLKDDDSGDHEQNEENSAQKDGEKEKTERDKSQSGGKRKVGLCCADMGAFGLETWLSHGVGIWKIPMNLIAYCFVMSDFVLKKRLFNH